MWQRFFVFCFLSLILPSVHAFGHEPIQPLPLSIIINQDKFMVGEMLFHDTHLSMNQDVSCASCHQIDHGLADNVAYSKNSRGELRTRNSQGLMNVHYFGFLHWDGEFADLLDLSSNAMEEAVSNPWPSILVYLKSEPKYTQVFKKAYDDITRDTVADALAEYQKSFVAPNSRFDQFLRGDLAVLTTEQHEGYLLFKSYGCVSCHNGVVIGGQMFAKLGQFGDYFKDRGNVTKTDYGRFNVTGNENDRYRFRVPSLRDIALTAPYFHDGTQATLSDAVQAMAKYQLGRKLPDHDVELIVEFLTTLTGKYQPNPFIGQLH